jgi:glycosyltransferase involved in cell wall biosynthesis/tetratricopeptide (TPR) repeat protein
VATGRKPTVRIEGAFFVHHSLAHVNRELAVALSACGWKVGIRPVEGKGERDRSVPHYRELNLMVGKCAEADVVLRHAFPPDLSEPVGPTVLMQPWEFFAAPDQWTRAANRVFDELWVNSNFTRTAYVRSGASASKVACLPLGVDVDVFTPEGDLSNVRQSDEEFLFLYVGGTITRKGIDVLLNAYLNEFRRSEPVRLVVKDTGTRHVYRHSNHAGECHRVASDSGLAKLTYLDEDMSSAGLAALYRDCDCLVHPYRAEGFCLPVLEAMACGLPTIVTAGGSTDDLVLHGTGWKVLASPVHIDQMPGLESSIAQAWLEPDVADLRAAMRDAFERRDGATKAFGEAASRLARDHWSWPVVAARYDEQLKSVVSRNSKPNVRRDGRPLISLCMIVRDEERVIEDCLRSARPFFDEIIVVDTGSKDRTKEIVSTYADNVIDFAWCDDFAAARNASIETATGEWVFWMDADDTLPPECGRVIVEAAKTAPSDIHGFVVPVQFVEEGPGAGTRVDHVKLFRNFPGVRFEGRIHEQILGTLRPFGGQIARCEAYVLHSGYDTSEEGQQKKRARDEKLLKLDLQDRPGHPFVLFNLGMTAHYTGDHHGAIDWLERCLEASHPKESHVRKAVSMLAVSLKEAGRAFDALEKLRAGLDLVGEDPEIRFHLGHILTEMGELDESAAHYEKAIGLDVSGFFSSIDVGILGFKTRHNLSGVYVQLGRREDARQQLRAAIQEAPQFMPSVFELFDLSIEDGDTATAKEMLDHVLRVDGPGKSWSEMLVKLAELGGGSDQVVTTIEGALSVYPGSVDLNRSVGKWALRRGDSDLGRKFLSTVARDDAESAYFLGVDSMRSGEYLSALEWMEQANRLNQGHEDTEEQIRNLRRLLEAEELASVQ